MGSAWPSGQSDEFWGATFPAEDGEAVVPWLPLAWPSSLVTTLSASGVVALMCVHS